MKKQLLFIIGALISAYTHSQSLTVLQDWKTAAGTQHFFYKNVPRTDGSGNVFVAGATQTAAGDYDILLAKYNSSGVAQWIKQIDGAAHYQDFATSIQLDGSGNVYIAGAITNDSVTMFSDLIVVKYNSSGTEQWRGTYDGANLYDCGTDIFVNSSGNVLVVGSSYNSSVNLDFVSVAYNSSGVQQWATRYDHTGLNDVPVSCTKLGSSIYVSGAVGTGTGTYDWAEVKYNNSGVQQAVKTSTGGTTGIEEVHAMVQDAGGNLYLAGITPTLTHGYDYDIIKMDSSLNILWEQTYDGAAHLNDIANGIQVSASGDVYVTGASRTTTTGDDYLTLKYNGSGSLIWAQTFNDSLNGNDVASAMAMDNAGKIIITGSAQTVDHGLDYYTVKYDTAGTQVWSIYYDGNKRLNDRATNIAIDTVGAIVVTGASETAAGVYEYATVRYIEKNVVTPTDFSGETPNPNFLFYENKGQLTASDFATSVPRVKYYTDYSFPALYVMSDTLSMVFTKIDTSATDTLQRINLTFPNCNEHLKVYSLEQQPTYLNYFIGSNEITNVHSYQRLVVPELYDNIDLMYYSSPAGFKYSFIIKPGGDPTDIKMQYSGATSTNLVSNILTINSDIRSVSYARPFVYSLDNANDTVSGSGMYADWHDNTGDNYDFNLHSYDSTKTLVLTVREDASTCTDSLSNTHIRVSTYYGGTNLDQIADMAIDTAQSVYYAGYCYSNSLPTTTGALYTSAGAYYTGVLTKFDYFGRRQYATYWGGTTGNTFVQGVTTNFAGSVTFVGQTGSSAFPIVYTASQHHQAYTGTGTDCFIARINKAGTIKEWSTCFGGADNEQFNNVVMNGNETYTVGKGTNNSPHVTRFGAYNSSTSPSGAKGLIAHFNSNDSLMWSTFIGDDIKDVDNAGIYTAIGGQIRTTDLPYTHAAGTYVDSSYGGGGLTDAFIGILNANDNFDYATYYGGTADDVCNAVKFDNVEGVLSLFATGSTASNAAAGFTFKNPGGGAYYDTIFGGESDAVFWKFSNTGVRLWTSFYGNGTHGAHIDNGKSIAIDKYHNVYFAGESNSQLERIQFTSTWFARNYSNTNGNYQAFVLGLGHNLSPFWATHFGGAIMEGCSGLAVDDRNHYLYLTGVTGTNSNAIGFPAFRPSTVSYVTPGGWYRCESASPAMDEGYWAQFKIAGAAVVGISEPSKPLNLSLISYPNPFTNEITFNFQVGDSRDYTIQVFNTLGQVVYSHTEKTASESVSKTIELPVNKGIYYVQIKSLNRTLAGKIIKQ
jgi:hypothetical protein